MAKELFHLGDKIKYLRESCGMTQSELARQMGLSRSSVNAWEMGLSIPSTQFIVELAKIFHVSADYLLGIEDTATISVSGLTEKQVTAVLDVVQCFRDAQS